MEYNYLGEYLIREGYVYYLICLRILIKKSIIEFAIFIVYVEYLNLVGTLKELVRIVDYLKSNFEVKDFGKTNFCLGLEIKYFPNKMYAKSTYINKVLKHFHMDKSYSQSP